MNLTRRLAVTATRTGMAVLAGLLFLGMVGAVTAASRQDAVVSDLLARRTQERMADRISPGRSPEKAFELMKLEGKYSPSSGSRRRDFMVWHGCGFGRVANFNPAPRTTKLPTNPVLVIGESYLKCQRITALLLAPAVSVEFYPKGYFGEYEYEGFLASERFEFTDEAVLEKIFQRVVEAVKFSDDDDLTIEDFFDDEFVAEMKLVDYRMGWVPEFMVEFVGEKPLRVEINLTKGRMLIQAGEKWDGYEIESSSAAALMALLWAERERQR